MTTFLPERRQVIRNVLQQLVKKAAERHADGISEELREVDAHLQAEELNLVVCGECKRGKSSLINALLDEPDLCPPDAPVATNAITMIRFGAQELIRVHLEDADGRPVTEDIDRRQLRDYVTEQGNVRNRLRVSLVQIWINNPLLKNGLVIIDTPGVGSLNVEHTAVTYGIIPYADAVLFVCAANEPLSVPELEFAERVAKHAERLLLVVTKADSVTNADEILRADMEKIRLQLQRRDIDGVAVSSYTKLEAHGGADEEALTLSGFTDLQDRIDQMLAARRDIVLGKAHARAVRSIDQLSLPIQTEIDVLSASSAEELRAIDDRLQLHSDRLQELATEQAFWVMELNRRMGLLQSDTDHRLSMEMAQVQRQLTEYLKDPDYLQKPDKLAQMLTVDCNNGAAVVIKAVYAEIDHITADLRELTKLTEIKGAKELTQGTDKGAAGPLKVAVRLPTARPADSDSTLGRGSTVLRSGVIQSSTLGTAGALAGGVLGGFIGTLVAPGLGTLAGAQAGAFYAGAIGTIFGGIFGIRRGINELSRKDLAALRQDLRGACREQLATAHKITSHGLSTLLTNERTQVHASLLREIQQNQRACKESMATSNEARQKQHGDLKGRLLRLNNDLRFLDNLRKALEHASDSAAAEPLRAFG
jgi:predicted GTPase